MSWDAKPWYHGTKNTLPLEIHPRPAAHPTTVYVFDAEHAVKVGITRGSAEERARGLAMATGIDPPLVVATFSFKTGPTARRVETIAHWLLRDFRTYGEWFSCHPVHAVDAVRRAMKQEAFKSYQEWWASERDARKVAA